MLGHLLRIAHSTIRETVKKNRSPEWKTVSHNKVAAVPQCEVCGDTSRLQVHHIQPFADHPELELTLTNLVVLCMGKNECHLRCGHGGSFKSFNPNILSTIIEAKAGKDLILIQQESKLNRVRI